MKMKSIQEILELDPDATFVIVDGFDEAVIGYVPNTMQLVYDIDRMIKIQKRTMSTEADAIEYLEFNTFCAYVGEQTPIFIRKIYS
jgi:hypothetical protein